MNQLGQILPTYCILAAGTGSRMKPHTDHINKILLPVENVSILGMILSQIQVDAKVVLAAGHKHQLIRDFVQLTYPERNIQFVQVDKFLGPGSGPGHSLLECEAELQNAFYLICGDSHWSEMIFDEPANIAGAEQSNWIGTSKFESTKGSEYCVLTFDHDRQVKQIYDKVKVSSYAEKAEAFNGLAYIADYELFFNGLRSGSQINGELQISAGFEALLVAQKKVLAKEISTWKDLGDLQVYTEMNLRNPQFRFRKLNENFYHENGKIIKFFADAQLTEHRFLRSKTLSNVIPQDVKARGHFLSYSYVTGASFYESVDTHSLEIFLFWADENLWREMQVSESDFALACDKFYALKTRQRVRSLTTLKPTRADLELIEAAIDKLARTKGQISIIHGDLQFDNILTRPNISDDRRFCLIDWRQNFADELEFGDLYYDLAKILSGICLDLSAIKAGQVTGDRGATTGSEMSEVLRRYCLQKNFDWRRVLIITGLIYVNMAPLHSAEVCRILWSRGIDFLESLKLRPALSPAADFSSDFSTNFSTVKTF